MSGKSHNEFVRNNREFLELYQAKNLQKETKEPALLEIEKTRYFNIFAIKTQNNLNNR